MTGLEAYCNNLCSEVMRLNQVWFKVEFGHARTSRAIAQWSGGVDVLNECAANTRDESKKKFWLEFGLKSLERAYEDGFREYVSVASDIGYDQLSARGLAGVHMLTLHECAHLMRYIIDGRRDLGESHGEGFIKHYLALLEQQPHDGIVLNNPDADPNINLKYRELFGNIIVPGVKVSFEDRHGKMVVERVVKCNPATFETERYKIPWSYMRGGRVRLAI